jgi:ankyrin repeat protein
MHMVSGNRHFDIVKLLVEQGATVDSRINNKQTTLDYAAGNGFLEIARFLIEIGRVRVCPRFAKGGHHFTTRRHVGISTS